MAGKSQLLNRVLIAAVGLPLLVALFYLGELWFAGLVAVIVLGSSFELLRLAGIQMRTLVFVLLVLQLYLVIGLFLNYPMIIIQVMVLGTVISGMSFLLLGTNEFTKQFAISGLMFIYPGLSLGSLILIREFPNQISQPYFDGFLILFLLYAALAICDTLAYFFGSAYGKTKLALTVSPNKSWEGAVAGFFGSLTIVLIAWKFSMISFFSLTDYLVVGFITGVAGQLGDLLESKIKREAGVKDSSHILMGHGGILDRFDSLSVAAPLLWIWLYIQYIR